MVNLYILAPNDRFNYGDLLFPHIICHYFSASDYNLIFCSTTESDLSDFGGIPTLAHKILYNANEHESNFLIIAGGDSLCIEWPLILSFIDKNIEKIDYFIRPKILNKFVKSLYIKKKYHIGTKFPYTIGKNELKNFNGIFYNSLGGAYLSQHLELLRDESTLEILKSADYLSVRDSVTADLLRNNNIQCKTVADSAILMSAIFQEEYLEGKLSKSLVKPTSKYLLFQINLTYAINNANAYSDLLNLVYQKYGYRIILCPIGTAYGHSDQEALSLIASDLISDSYQLIHKPSIWDIMWLIKHSVIYIGTSLHGTITAMSFGVPFAVHGPIKLKYYLNCWGGEQFFANDHSDLKTIINQQLIKPDRLDSESQKATVLKSFNTIKNLIDCKI